jgi:hypothetical protein
MQGDARHLRRLARTRLVERRLRALCAADWSGVDGETLAVLVTGHLSFLDGVASSLPRQCASLPEPVSRGLYTSCCVLMAEDEGRKPAAVLRALVVTDLLGRRAVEEVAARLDQHVGAWAGLWWLENHARSEMALPATEDERRAAMHVRKGSLRRVLAAAKARARRDGNPWFAMATDAELTDALVMAIAELARGRDPVQLAAHALDGALDVSHVRAVNRESAARNREIRRRRRTIEFRIEDTEPVAVGETPERAATVREVERRTEQEPRLRAARRVIDGETQQEVASDLKVTARTVRNYLTELARVTRQTVPQDIALRTSRRSLPPRNDDE